MRFQSIRNAGVAAVAALALSLPAVQAETLKFVSWQKDESGVGEWWAEAIAKFEADHPGVSIEWTKVARNEYADTMTTLFASGAPPDIIHLASFEYHNFAEQGWMENLDPWIENAGLDLEGWAGQQACVWNGETACIMLLYFGFIMAYNQAILDEAGVAVPTNFEEYMAASRALTKDTDGDGIIDQFGTGHQTSSGGGQYLTEMLNYVLDAGARWTTPDGMPAFDTPEMVEGLRRWKTVVQEGLTPRDLNSGDVRQIFIDGKMGLKVDGPWLYGLMRTARPEVFEQLKVTRPPFDPPLGGSSNVIGMASEISDEKKQLVWDFIAIIASDEFQSKFASMAASTPPSPRADTSGALEAVPHFPLLIETQMAAAAAGVDRIPTGLEIQFNRFAKLVTEAAQRMIIEDQDPADTAAWIQEQAMALK